MRDHAHEVVELVRGRSRSDLDSDRLLALAKNTLLLLVGTLALSLPLGVLGAALLYRTDLPLRRLLRFLTVLTLFVPLPLRNTP